jgi:purine catabolism regulator
MPLTVAALFSMPGLDAFTVLAGRRHLSERTITWAHVIELCDPTPWLQGGELVLTTGLALDPDDEDVQCDYVRRLAGAGAAALGFGTGLSHEAVPAAVCAQADELGLPLFEVPRPVPFLAVTKSVAGRPAAELYETVQRAVEAQRRLTRAALDRGMPGILAALIRLVPGWALVLDRRGQVLAAHPADAARRADAVRAELSRHPARSTQVAISVAVADFNATIQSLGKSRSGAAIWRWVTGTRRPRSTGSSSDMPRRWQAWSCSAR